MTASRRLVVWPAAALLERFRGLVEPQDLHPNSTMRSCVRVRERLKLEAATCTVKDRSIETYSEPKTSTLKRFTARSCASCFLAVPAPTSSVEFTNMRQDAASARVSKPETWEVASSGQRSQSITLSLCAPNWHSSQHDSWMEYKP